MSKRRIGAVTFDLWNCLFVDDSDEPKRAAAGLPPKPVTRRALVHEALNRHAPIARETVDLAYNVTDAAFPQSLARPTCYLDGSRASLGSCFQA